MAHRWQGDQGRDQDRLSAPTSTLDGEAMRRWILLAEAVAADSRDLVDGLNVFPVPDSDTGTNMLLTLRAAREATERLPRVADAVQVARTVADGAVRGARGNSGLLVSQALAALADVCADAPDPSGLRPVELVHALEQMASSTWAAVSRPVTGTLLTVARDAAASARAVIEESTAQAPASLSTVAAAAALGSQEAVVETAGLGHGPVDAGAAAFMLLLTSLSDTVNASGGDGSPQGAWGGPQDGEGVQGAQWSDRAPYTSVARQMLVDLARGGVAHAGGGSKALGGPQGMSTGEFEVMYLLEATSAQAERLREDLERVGDSVGVVGTPDDLGVGVYQVHVHTDTPRSALPRQGRARQICVHHLHPVALVAPADEPPSPWEPADPAGHVVSFERLARRRAERRAQSVRMHPSQATPAYGTPQPDVSQDEQVAPGRLGRPRTVGVIACTRAPGLVEQLARTGAVVVLEPDRDAVVRAVGDLGAAQVLVLPCDAACTEAAHEAARFLAARAEAATVTVPSGGRQAADGGPSGTTPLRRGSLAQAARTDGPQLVVCDTDNEARVLAAAVAVAGQQRGAALTDLARRASQAGARLRTTALNGPDAEPEAVLRTLAATLRADDEMLTVITGRRASSEVGALALGAAGGTSDVLDHVVEQALDGRAGDGAATDVEVVLHAGGQEEPDVLIAIE